MTDIDLAAIRQRVHGINNGSHPVRFFEARDDLNALLAEIDRLNATIQRVREIERRMDEYAHRSGPCTGVNCGGCQAGRFSTALRRALEGGEKDERIQAWEAIAALGGESA